MNGEIVAWLHDELDSSQVITNRIRNILIASTQKSAKHYTIQLCKYEPTLIDFPFNKEFTALLKKTEQLHTFTQAFDEDAKLKIAVEALQAILIGQTTKDYNLLLSTIGMAAIAKQALEKIGEV